MIYRGSSFPPPPSRLFFPSFQRYVSNGLVRPSVVCHSSSISSCNTSTVLLYAGFPVFNYELLRWPSKAVSGEAFRWLSWRFTESESEAILLNNFFCTSDYNYVEIIMRIDTLWMAFCCVRRSHFYLWMFRCTEKTRPKDRLNNAGNIDRMLIVTIINMDCS